MVKLFPGAREEVLETYLSGITVIAKVNVAFLKNTQVVPKLGVLYG